MNLRELNALIQKAQQISDEQVNGTMSSALNEQLLNCLNQIHSLYGHFLQNKLDEVYNNFFSNDQIKPLEQYLITDGVEVKGGVIHDHRSRLVIRPFPLRFETVGVSKPHKQILWQEADSRLSA